MKSSPRPPRRFSRWQTTKRTFVLGGIGPKSLQTSSNQERNNSGQGSGEEPAVGSDVAESPHAKGSSSGFESKHTSTQSPQRSTKPKHVRKLRLDSSNLAGDTGKQTNPWRGEIEKPDEADVQSEGPVVEADTADHPPVLTQISLAAPGSSTHAHKGDRDQSEQMSSLRLNGKLPDRNSSKSDSMKGLSDASLSSEKSSKPRGQTRSSLRRRNQNAERHKENESVVNGSSESASVPIVSLNISKVDVDALATSMGVNTNKVDNSRDSSKASIVQGKLGVRKSASIQGAESRDTLREVSGITLNVSANTDITGGPDGSLTGRTSLRDRSKMKSPAEMMQMRNYPERFLTGSQRKSINTSLEKKNKRKTKVGGKASSISEESSLSRSEKSSGSQMVQASSKSSTSGIQVGELSSKGSNASLKQTQAAGKTSANRTRKAKVSPQPLDISEQSLNKTSLKGNLGNESQKISGGSNSSLKQTQAAGKTSGNRTRNAKVSPQPFEISDQSLKKTSLKSKLSLEKQKISEVKRQSVKEKQLSLGEKSEQDGTGRQQHPDHVSPSHSPGLIVERDKSVEAGLASKESQEMPSKLTERGNEISSDSSKNRSLRDRKQLRLPESRQYPIHFYSSKTRESILNTRASAKSKTLNNTKQLQSLDSTRTSVSPNKSEVGLGDRTNPVSNARQRERGLDNKLSRKRHVLLATSLRKLSPKKAALGKKPPLSARLLPRQSRKGLRVEDSSSDRGVPPQSLDNQLQEDELWEIMPASRKSVDPIRPVQRRGQAETHSRVGSTVDDTVLGRGNKVQRKRKLVDQLSQAEGEDRASKTKDEGRRETVLLWCEEGQTRSVTDVNPYDVIFQAALDVERELSESSEDRLSERLVKKVFSEFKRSMKATITQELKVKMLEKEVRERRRKCKNLQRAVAEKQEEVGSLEQDMRSLDTDEGSNLQRISGWMRDFSLLSQQALNDQDV